MPGWFDTQGFRDPNERGDGSGFVGPNGEVFTPQPGSGGRLPPLDPAIRDSIRYSNAPGASGYDVGEYNPGGGGGDMNPAGAASDPFAYTQGSLLTPWTRSFSSEGYGGGYSVPEFKPFSFGDFSYKPPSAGRFDEQYADPAAFRFADFNAPEAFKAPTREDMEADPGYAFRRDQGLKARTASAANRGSLRTGGFMKGLEDYAQGLASQEYGNVYNRRAAESDRNYGRAKDTYGVNRGNVKEAFDTNVGNRLNAYNTRQNTWRGNADVALQEGQLGFSVASGAWDRNYQKNRTAWDDERQYANQVASAGAANANQNYTRALGDYMRDRDEFWTNQDRQYAILDREANRGLGAAGQYGSQMMSGYGTIGNLALGKGDARAAGTVGSANAWNGALGTIGGYAGDMAMAYGRQGQSGPAALPRGRYEGPNQGSGEGYW